MRNKDYNLEDLFRMMDRNIKILNSLKLIIDNRPKSTPEYTILPKKTESPKVEISPEIIYEVKSYIRNFKN